MCCEGQAHSLPHMLLTHPLLRQASSTCPCISPQVRLLEQLAVNKVQEGDDDGARRVLQVRHGGRGGGVDGLLRLITLMALTAQYGWLLC